MKKGEGVEDEWHVAHTHTQTQLLYFCLGEVSVLSYIDLKEKSAFN